MGAGIERLSTVGCSECQLWAGILCIPASLGIGRTIWRIAIIGERGSVSVFFGAF